nr:MAG TPA: hypothetical protein [Caudoviricetes sp.]
MCRVMILNLVVYLISKIKIPYRIMSPIGVLSAFNKLLLDKQVINLI